MCKMFTKKRFQEIPTTHALDRKTSIFGAPVHLADQVFVASSRDITCVHYKIINQSLYKNHVCSLHDTWDSIQPKRLHFMIVRPMEVEHAISNKSRCLSNIAIFHWTMIVTEWPSCQLIWISAIFSQIEIHKSRLKKEQTLRLRALKFPAKPKLPQLEGWWVPNRVVPRFWSTVGFFMFLYPKT